MQYSIAPAPALPLESGNIKISSTTEEQAQCNAEIYGTSLDCTFPDDEVFGPRTRLLRIKPGVWHQPIRCDLRTEYIFDARYTALSYSWGTEPRSSLLLIGDKETPFAVLDHVHAALRRLRHRTDIVSVWVDGICINQDNVIERQAQIKIMAQIFSAAEDVLIWLGEGEGLAGLPDEELFWRMCRTSTPWWKRLWVVQECAYSTDCPTVLLGNQRFSLESMVQRWEAVVQSYAPPGTPERPEKKAKCSARLRELRSHLDFLRMPYDAFKAPSHRIPLLARLRQTSKRQCTIAHDTVFAVLSLIHFSDAERVPLDYRLPFPQFKDRVEEILRESPDWDETEDSQPLLLSFEELTRGTTAKFALRRAASLGDLGALKTLVRHDEALIGSYEARSACGIALRLGHEEFAQYLLRSGVEPPSQEESSSGPRMEDPSTYRSWLSFAAMLGDDKAATQLYREQFEAATEAGTRKAAVRGAASGYHKEALRTLIWAILEKASEATLLYGHAQMTPMLFTVRLASVVAMDAGELLSYAVMSDDVTLVKKVLDTGMYVNAPQSIFQPLMEEAAYRGSADLVRVLLDNGGEAAAEGNRLQSWSPLAAASAAGYPAVVQLLLERVAVVFGSCPFYGNAICAASAGGHVAIVKMLLDHGAIVNASCSVHGNAWSAASRAKHEIIETMLQEAGADAIHRDPGYRAEGRMIWLPVSWRPSGR